MIITVVAGFFILAILTINAAYSTDDRNRNDEYSSEIIDCGSYLANNMLLDHDLDCSSDGLIIQDKAGLVVDLNGYSIIGPGTESENAGIIIDNSKNIEIIGLGEIKNFKHGIRANSGSSINVSSITFQNNGAGIISFDSKNSIVQNSAFKFNGVGTWLQSNFNFEILNNTYDSNDLAGITLEKSSESKISGNNVEGSINGIFLDGDSNNNIIENNDAFENRGVDLNNGNGLEIEVNDNTFLDNNCNKSVPDGLCSDS